MVTLIQESKTSGRRRRCGAKCYDAKRPRCVCVCDGRNHGKGFRAAMQITYELYLHELQEVESGEKSLDQVRDYAEAIRQLPLF